MKDKLTALFNTMKQIETKGDSTIIMADCLRELVRIINDIPEETESEA